MNMAGLLHQTMAVSNLEPIAAKKLLRRICNAVSNFSSIDVHPNYYSGGMVCIMTVDREIATIKRIAIASAKSTGRPVCEMFFEKAAALVEKMLSPNSVLCFYPIGKKEKVEIDTSKMFGTTLDEANLKLDLMEV